MGRVKAVGRAFYAVDSSSQATMLIGMGSSDGVVFLALWLGCWRRAGSCMIRVCMRMW